MGEHLDAAPRLPWATGAALAAVRLDGATPRTRQARKNPQSHIEIRLEFRGSLILSPARPDELVQGAGATRGRSGGHWRGCWGWPAGDIRVRHRPE
jgi:hypothetical protein